MLFSCQPCLVHKLLCFVCHFCHEVQRNARTQSLSKLSLTLFYSKKNKALKMKDGFVVLGLVLTSAADSLRL